MLEEESYIYGPSLMRLTLSFSVMLSDHDPPEREFVNSFEWLGMHTHNQRVDLICTYESYNIVQIKVFESLP